MLRSLDHISTKKSISGAFITANSCFDAEWSGVAEAHHSYGRYHGNCIHLTTIEDKAEEKEEHLKHQLFQ